MSESGSGKDPLDRALASLPREVEPPRDLWPGIAARIDRAGERVHGGEQPGPGGRGLYRLAAVLVVIFATAAIAFLVGREFTPRQDAARLADQAPHDAPGFGVEQLGPEYMFARATLRRTLDERLATLSPETRAGIERSLADLRRASDEIAAQLAEHPGHPLLQELLLSAYQVELAVLADVNQVASATPEDPI